MVAEEPLRQTGVTFKNQVTLGPKSNGVLEYDTFNYTDYEYFDGQMQAIVTNNNFSGAKARAQGTGGPINLEGNYWGPHDANWIAQNMIYDHADASYLPVIDFEPFLAAAPVPPTEAWQRQVYQLSAAAFDGAGNDISLWLGDVVAGQQVQVFAGQTLQDLRSVGTFTSSGTSPWFLPVDIHAANPSLIEAEYVAVGSDKPVIVLSAAGLHPNIADLSGSGYQQYTATTSSQPNPTNNNYANVAQLYQWNVNTKQFGPSPLSPSVWSTAVNWSNPTIILTHGWNGTLDIGTNGVESDGSQEYIWAFAKSLGQSASQYNILAVDWSGHGDSLLVPLGANPNGKSLAYDLAFDLGDACTSAINGILVGQSFAETLVDTLKAASIQLNPGNLMLVGHSNGSGFMASMGA